jgi:uncharacterized coiled-coil protein SlyX
MFDPVILKQNLRSLGLKYQDAAEVVGVTKGCLSNWANGYASPGESKLSLLKELGWLEPSVSETQLSTDLVHDNLFTFVQSFSAPKKPSKVPFPPPPPADFAPKHLRLAAKRSELEAGLNLRLCEQAMVIEDLKKEVKSLTQKTREARKSYLEARVSPGSLVLDPLLCPTCGDASKITITRYGRRDDCRGCETKSWGGKPLPALDSPF